jgi:hypothetical protein
MLLSVLSKLWMSSNQQFASRAWRPWFARLFRVTDKKSLLLKTTFHGLVAMLLRRVKYHVSNPEVQPHNVLIRKWSITSGRKSPDVESLRIYESIYRSPIGSSQHRTLHGALSAAVTR